MKGILLGVLASFFFAFTFILNRSMELSGGSWIWSASLRYIFMVPFLFAIVIWRGNWKPLWSEMRAQPRKWLLWSFVGFGLFYAPISYAAAFGPGWLIAGTWQVTIISGSLLVPLFYQTLETPTGTIKIREKIPIKGLLMSSIILLGVVIMQIEHMNQISFQIILLGVIPVLIASFAYPLGNRKMMEVCQGKLDVFQRVLGMTLASLPFWLLLSSWGLVTVGTPNSDQILQSLLVAITSGVIATILFFRATDLAKNNMQKLAAVEATQSLEILFALIGELIILGAPFPSFISMLGICIIIIGMVLHSYISHSNKKELKQKISA